VAKLKTTVEPVDPSALERKGSNTARDLLSFVERHERLSEEISGLTADRKEVMEEAKSRGFDAKTIKQVLAARKIGYDAYEEQDDLTQTYLRAVRQAEADQTAASKAAGE
jgi:uncharacterized protein (UPF0335 family)